MVLTKQLEMLALTGYLVLTDYHCFLRLQRPVATGATEVIFWERELEGEADETGLTMSWRLRVLGNKHTGSTHGSACFYV